MAVSRQRGVVSGDGRLRAASAAEAMTGVCRGLAALSPCRATEKPLHRWWQQRLPAPCTLGPSVWSNNSLSRGDEKNSNYISQQYLF